MTAIDKRGVFPQNIAVPILLKVQWILESTFYRCKKYLNYLNALSFFLTDMSSMLYFNEEEILSL